MAAQSEYAKLLEETLGTGSSNSRILAFKNKVHPYLNVFPAL